MLTHYTKLSTARTPGAFMHGGKSIGFKSPSSFQSELKRKAENAGGTVLMFSTRKTALSQTCLCGNKQKKLLSQRVHHCS
ncbi:MAG: hypothetical protein ACREPR_21120, partial [Brasilonema sp.]